MEDPSGSVAITRAPTRPSCSPVQRALAVIRPMSLVPPVRHISLATVSLARRAHTSRPLESRALKGRCIGADAEHLHPGALHAPPVRPEEHTACSHANAAPRAADSTSRTTITPTEVTPRSSPPRRPSRPTSRVARHDRLRAMPRAHGPCEDLREAHRRQHPDQGIERSHHRSPTSQWWTRPLKSSTCPSPHSSLAYRPRPRASARHRATARAALRREARRGTPPWTAPRRTRHGRTRSRPTCRAHQPCRPAYATGALLTCTPASLLSSSSTIPYLRHFIM